MKIEIKLKDPESCEGCPLKVNTTKDEYIVHGFICYKSAGFRLWKIMYPFRHTLKRPKRCKEENGL